MKKKSKPTLFIYYRFIANELYQKSYYQMMQFISNQKTLNFYDCWQTTCLDFFNFKYLDIFEDVVILDIHNMTLIDKLNTNLNTGKFTLFGKGKYISLKELNEFDRHYYQYEIPYSDDLSKFIKNDMFNLKPITKEFISELPLNIILSHDDLNKVKEELKYDIEIPLKEARQVICTIP